MKRLRALLVLVFVTFLLVVSWVNRPTHRPVGAENALILQKVQALGDLHAARYEYQDLFDYTTSQEPARWVAAIPFGKDLVESATRNRGLIAATGSVEAGVDLRRAQVVRSATGIRVVVPHPKVYEPTVKAWVHDARPGLAWRDDNLGLKAAEETKARMRTAAIRQGIVEQASTNAIDQVKRLVASATDREVEVVVDPAA